MRRAFIVLAMVVGGCSDDPKPAGQIDAPAGSACTGAPYDPCTTASQCMSTNCHNYNGLQVCVTACTPGDNTTCPTDSTGAHGTCNNMSICKPAAANKSRYCFSLRSLPP